MVLLQDDGGSGRTGAQRYDSSFCRRSVTASSRKVTRLTRSGAFCDAESSISFSCTHCRSSAPTGMISGSNYYYTRDQIGSVREMTNSSGVVQSQFNFDPFGRPTQIAGSGAVPDFGFAVRCGAIKVIAFLPQRTFRRNQQFAAADQA